MYVIIPGGLQNIIDIYLIFHMLQLFVFIVHRHFIFFYKIYLIILTLFFHTHFGLLMKHSLLFCIYLFIYLLFSIIYLHLFQKKLKKLYTYVYLYAYKTQSDNRK